MVPGVVSLCGGIIKRHCSCSCRDGGLKRGKVKDSYKEEQQKMYSSIIVGQNDLNSPKACRENTEVTGVTGPAVWLPFLPPLPSDMWTGWTLLVLLRTSPTLFNSESLILHFLNTSTFYFSLLFVLCVCGCVCVFVCECECRSALQPAGVSVWQHNNPVPPPAPATGSLIVSVTSFCVRVFKSTC